MAYNLACHIFGADFQHSPFVTNPRYFENDLYKIAMLNT